jgi:hypothetical protein
MSTFISASIIALSAGRIALGLAPFVAAAPSARLVGFPAEHDNATARLMGRLFGVRDIGLGVLGLYALAHPEVRTFIFLLNAAMDAGDLVAVAMALGGRAGIDRGAWRSAAAAATGGLGWLLLSWLA